MPQPIRTRPAPRDGLVGTVSRSHLDPQTVALLERLGVTTRLPCGSALKFCRVAEGAADIYPRLATTCEWDVAAGHALVEAAGGAVTGPQGAPFATAMRRRATGSMHSSPGATAALVIAAPAKTAALKASENLPATSAAPRCGHSFARGYF